MKKILGILVLISMASTGVAFGQYKLPTSDSGVRLWALTDRYQYFDNEMFILEATVSRNLNGRICTIIGNNEKEICQIVSKRAEKAKGAQFSFTFFEAKPGKYTFQTLLYSSAGAIESNVIEITILKHIDNPVRGDEKYESTNDGYGNFAWFERVFSDYNNDDINEWSQPIPLANPPFGAPRAFLPHSTTWASLKQQEVGK